MIKRFWEKIVDYIAGTGAGRVPFPQFATVMLIVVVVVFVIPIFATVMLIAVVFVIPILVAFLD